MLVDPIDDACAATRFSKKNHALTIRAPLAPSAQSASAGPTDHSGSAAADPAEYLEADSVTPQAASETAEVARLSRMLKRTRCANCVASLCRADLRRCAHSFAGGRGTPDGYCYIVLPSARSRGLGSVGAAGTCLHVECGEALCIAAGLLQPRPTPLGPRPHLSISTHMHTHARTRLRTGMRARTDTRARTYTHEYARVRYTHEYARVRARLRNLALSRSRSALRGVEPPKVRASAERRLRLR